MIASYVVLPGWYLSKRLLKPVLQQDIVILMP